MRAFASDETMTSSHDCPTSEELAAYIDGMLGPEEGARITEHLASCERCYELYTEVLRFQLDSAEEEADSGGKVVAFPQSVSKRAGVLGTVERERVSIPSRWREVPWWIGVAAAAMVLVGMSLGMNRAVWALYQAIGPQLAPQRMAVARLTKPFEKDPSRAADQLWGYAVYRGSGDLDEEYSRSGFQVGALLVDFRLATKAGRVQQASDILKTIGNTVRAGIIPEDGDRLIAQANRIESAESLAAVAGEFAKEEKVLADSFDTTALYFGKWTEAGRLAAILQEPKFFNWGNRRFLKSLLKDNTEEVELDDQVLARLRQIEAVWEKGDLQPADYAALAQSFQGILDYYDFRG